MTRPVFQRLAVIGLGLLGGSVALGARTRGLAGEVRGVDPGFGGDAPFPVVSLEEAGRWASAVVLAVPVDSVEAVLRELSQYLSPEALLTDTVSVKEPVAKAAQRWLVDPGRCVGAHPMAGGDQSGFEHADPDLFEGAACILALSGTEPAAVVDRIDEFWQGLGTFTVRQSPKEHDALVAVLSHVPHLIAFAFASGLPEDDALKLAGPGLRDFIRIARANPELWSEILLRNRNAVAEEAARFLASFEDIVDALAREDGEAVRAALCRGRTAIEKL